MRIRGRTTLVALAVLLAGCGGGDGGDGETPSASSASSASSAPSASATAGGGRSPAADGKAFEDPQGQYTLTIGETWKKVPAPKSVSSLPGQKEAEYWTIGKAEKGFTPNVNVITQDTGGIDLKAYKKLSEDQSKQAHLTVVSSKLVENADGDQIGVIEYTGDPTGSGTKAHFLATYAVSHGKAVIATLSTSSATFKKHRTRVEPLLLTLART